MLLRLFIFLEVVVMLGFDAYMNTSMMRYDPPKT